MTVLKIAWRNIWRNRNRSFVIMLSVAVGFFCGIFVLAIYKGMIAGRVKTVIESETGSLQFHEREFKSDLDPKYVLQNRSDIIHTVQSMKHVIGIAERSVTQGMLSTTTGSTGIQINGIELDEENRVTHIKEKLLAKADTTVFKRNSILIGKKLAVKMKLKKGSKLVLTFTDTSSNLVSAAFRVTGIYQSDNAPLDERNVYINRTALNELLGIGSSVHEIAILLDGDEYTDTYKKELQTKFPSTLIQTWRDLSPETELMVNTIDVYSYIIIGIILFALSFGIINTMLMAVLERTREIGMMMALGLNKSRLFLMIVLETIFLTVAGVPLGFIVSLLITQYYAKQGMDWSGMGEEMMSSFGFKTTLYPVFPFDHLLSILLLVLATALFSCILPAFKALHLKPVDAIRK